MSGRRQPDDWSRPRPRDPRRRDVEPAPLAGPHIGRLRVTPARVTLAVALLLGLLFLAYSVLVRDALQVPLMATGFAICGVVFAAVSVLAVLEVVEAGRDGRDRTAVLAALFGGAVAVASLLSFAIAVIMSMIWSGTKSG